jgi:hypothetical protein
MRKRREHLWRAAVWGLVLLLVAVGPVSAAADSAFSAHLSGAQEVPPVQSLARGQAIFRLSSDGTELHYKLIVANLQDTRMAHIHLAPAGVNGPVVAWLYPGGPPPVEIPGRFSGVLAEGTITAANLVGPLAGMTLENLVDAMRAGDTYVNVHTVAYPGGEIRGQIEVQGP